MNKNAGEHCYCIVYIGNKDAYAGTYHVFLSKKERMGRETHTHKQ
jgi:hypothetical protein